MAYFEKVRMLLEFVLFQEMVKNDYLTTGKCIDY